MKLENSILKLHNRIKRAKLTNAGLIIEVDTTNETEENIIHLFDQIADFAWNKEKEIIYSIYGFSSLDSRFVVDAILRENQTEYSFNMSTSTLGANDVYCRFTRFDFDSLTLANRDENTLGLFIIDSFSPSKKPTIKYAELDIQGHQFPISSYAKKVDASSEIYEIVLQPSELY